MVKSFLLHKNNADMTDVSTERLIEFVIGPMKSNLRIGREFFFFWRTCRQWWHDWRQQGRQSTSTFHSSPSLPQGTNPDPLSGKLLKTLIGVLELGEDGGYSLFSPSSRDQPRPLSGKSLKTVIGFLENVFVKIECWGYQFLAFLKAPTPTPKWNFFENPNWIFMLQVNLNTIQQSNFKTAGVEGGFNIYCS